VCRVMHASICVLNNVHIFFPTAPHPSFESRFSCIRLSWRHGEGTVTFALAAPPGSHPPAAPSSKLQVRCNGRCSTRLRLLGFDPRSGLRTHCTSSPCAPSHPVVLWSALTPFGRTVCAVGYASMQTPRHIGTRSCTCWATAGWWLVAGG
jgi:hypothetical protein